MLKTFRSFSFLAL